jgi:hypothetical protein
METFVRFMASNNGRMARIVAGIALIIGGLVSGGNGTLLAVIGAVPLLAGVFDLCFFAPVCGLPVNGAKIRSSK